MNKQFLNDANNLISILIHAMANGWTLDLKIAYIKQVLPPHYEVTESKQKGNIHCKSAIGINDDEHWGFFMSALKDKFKDEFLEVYHNTCYNHVDFTVYFRSVGKKTNTIVPVVE
jgi:hypothetical protein